MVPYKVGDIIEGTVVRVYPKYAIMLFENNRTGLLHISEISDKFIHSFPDLIKTGNIYKVKVIEVDELKDSMRVSLKRLTYEERSSPIKKEKVREENVSFDALKDKIDVWKEEARRENE